MADLFGRQDQELLGGLSSDSMFVSWPELAAIGGGLGLLIQQIGLQYSQSVRRIFEIGPGVLPGGGSAVLCDGAGQSGAGGAALGALCANRIQPNWYIVGRPEGQLQFQRFVGPNALSSCFYRKYGSPCSTNYMSISGRAGCSAADPTARRMTWTLRGVLLNGVGMNIDGREMVVQENLQAQFVGLSIDIEGDNTNCGATNNASATATTASSTTSTGGGLTAAAAAAANAAANATFVAAGLGGLFNGNRQNRFGQAIP